eukprot:Gb_04355 [translate_table: standard]
MASTAMHSPCPPCQQKQHEYPAHYKGVKALVDTGIHSIPQIYVRPFDQRPGHDISTQVQDQELPLIDIADLEGEGRSAVVQAIGQACHQWGFFLVKNHGVSESTMDAMMRVGREFFHLPSEEKMRYFSTDIKSKMRYATSFNVKEDKVLNWRDFLRYSCHPVEEMMLLWPDEPNDFREANAEYCREIRKLAKKLLGAISESLGLPTEYINEAFGDHSQIMACNFYPACPNPDLTLGFVGHSDPGGVTILMQDEVGGLQVLHDDSWVGVQPVPNTLVVNLGDMMQILSNGKYRSAEHRVVVNSNEDRLSVPTAYGPAMDSFIAPAPQLLDSSHPPVYKGCVYGEFMDALQTGSPIKNGIILSPPRQNSNRYAYFFISTDDCIKLSNIFDEITTVGLQCLEIVLCGHKGNKRSNLHAFPRALEKGCHGNSHNRILIRHSMKLVGRNRTGGHTVGCYLATTKLPCQDPSQTLHCSLSGRICSKFEPKSRNQGTRNVNNLPSSSPNVPLTCRSCGINNPCIVDENVNVFEAFLVFVEGFGELKMSACSGCQRNC